MVEAKIKVVPEQSWAIVGAPGQVWQAHHLTWALPPTNQYSLLLRITVQVHGASKFY